MFVYSKHDVIYWDYYHRGCVFNERLYSHMCVAEHFGRTSRERTQRGANEMMSVLMSCIRSSSVLTLGGDIQLCHRAADAVLTKGWLTVRCAKPSLHTCVLTCDQVRGAGDLVKLLHIRWFSFILSRYHCCPQGQTPPSSSIQTDVIWWLGGLQLKHYLNKCTFDSSRFYKCVWWKVGYYTSTYAAHLLFPTHWKH